MRPWLLATAVAVSSLIFSPSARAQGHVMTPPSSLPQPRDANGNIMARTTIRIYVPPTGKISFGWAVQPSELPPFAGYFFETPASAACVYALVSVTPGCDPNVTTTNPKGGARALAVVDAFDDPTAESDLAMFSTQFGLPAANFTVVYANGTEPMEDPTGGWELEEALDTQWSHALAPEARIYLVEAADNSFINLFNAVSVASKLVKAAGGGEVSMSWGAGEFSGEALYDSYLTTPRVVYFASAGDSPGVMYPSASPNVVSAGGTTISRNSTTGNFIAENTWQSAGGGPSQFEPRPAFQNGVGAIVGNSRGTPDFSFDADPNTGVWLFDTNPVYGTGWFVVGGTSVSAPSLAGIVNAAGTFNSSSQAENQELYVHLSDPSILRDIVYGDCGLYIGDFALPGYDFCSGVGSDIGLDGK
jgi:kumamolisin